MDSYCMLTRMMLNHRPLCMKLNLFQKCFFVCKLHQTVGLYYLCLSFFSSDAIKILPIEDGIMTTL